MTPSHTYALDALDGALSVGSASCTVVDGNDSGLNRWCWCSDMRHVREARAEYYFFRVMAWCAQHGLMPVDSGRGTGEVLAAGDPAVHAEAVQLLAWEEHR